MLHELGKTFSKLSCPSAIVKLSLFGLGKPRILQLLLPSLSVQSYL